MSIQALYEPTLVLNKSWSAFNIETAKESIVRAFTGTAHIIDENYTKCDWNKWVKESQKYDDDENFIHTNKLKIRVPKVIVLSKYNRIPNIKVKLTRRNLLIRDKHRCQYTGKKVTMKNATIDHVFPKSRGGKTTWDNVVIASFEANIQKGNRTPEEAGLKLIREPRKPVWNLMYAKHISKIPKFWEKFINTDQWNEIGYWDVELID